jgi:hypothetical protein
MPIGNGRGESNVRGDGLDDAVEGELEITPATVDSGLVGRVSSSPRGK